MPSAYLDWIGARRHDLHAFCNDGCRQDRGCGGAITCCVVCLCCRLQVDMQMRFSVCMRSGPLLPGSNEGILSLLFLVSGLMHSRPGHCCLRLCRS